MAKKQRQDTFVIGLEENAFNSLEHGVEHFLAGSDRDLKFTVLHVFHAVELLLKARLAKAHPLLIFQKPEDDPQRAHTVDYGVMLRRLKNVGVRLSADDAKNLDYLHTMRNSIEHFEVVADRSEIEGYVARTMKFLDHFVQKELGIKLKERISQQVYHEMEIALYSYTERQERVQREMDDAIPGRLKERLNYWRVACDECGEETVLVPDPTSQDERVHCFSCGTKFYYWTCDRCGTPILSTSPVSERASDTCEACWADIMSKDWLSRKGNTHSRSPRTQGPRP